MIVMNVPFFEQTQYPTIIPTIPLKNTFNPPKYSLPFPSHILSILHPPIPMQSALILSLLLLLASSTKLNNQLFGNHNLLHKSNLNSLLGNHNFLHQSNGNQLLGNHNLMANSNANTLFGHGNSLDNSNYNYVLGLGNSLGNSNGNTIGGI